VNPSTRLSEEERDDFRRRFHQRLEKVKPKTADVFAFREMDEPPFLVNSAFYWVSGLDTDDFPDAYFDDPSVMTDYQERLYYNQVREIDDDFVPYLMPWFGTVVAASAFGCRIEYPPRQDPAADPRHFPVQTPEDIRRLEMPDPEKDGLMPKVLDFIRHMKKHSFLPVGITDFQGPLTTANLLMGYDKLIYLMHDDPTAMHELMDKLTEALILWVKKQKALIGEPINECIGNQQVYLGKNAGIWFSDDDAVLMSPKSYKEFVVPYNSRILKAFDGGCLHYCGNATHQADNFLNTEGLLAINNYNLYNVKAVHELKAMIEGRIVLFLCDFSPVDYEQYFREMLDGLSLRGLIVDSQYSPVMGLLKGGRYNATRSDLSSGRRAVFDSLRGQLRRLGSKRHS